MSRPVLHDLILRIKDHQRNDDFEISYLAMVSYFFGTLTHCFFTGQHDGILPLRGLTAFSVAPPPACANRFAWCGAIAVSTPRIFCQLRGLV